MAGPTNPIPRSSPFFRPPKGQVPAADAPAPAVPDDPVITALAATLGEALRRDLGTDALPNPEGWLLTDIAPRKLVRLGACATFTHQGRTLRALVSPTDPANENPYFRTKGYDMAYFFDDVPEEQRSGIWQEHRALLDGLAAWLAAWDGDTEET